MFVFSFLSEALHSIVSFINWKQSVAFQILRSFNVVCKDDVKSPLLEAYSRYFAGKFWIRGASVRPEAMSTRILGPGEGLYDALQLCRHRIFPTELCQALLGDVIQELEYAQLGICPASSFFRVVKVFCSQHSCGNGTSNYKTPFGSCGTIKHRKS